MGLEHAGMKVVWQVEINDYCNERLQRRWPDVTKYGDVRDCHGAEACPTLADADRTWKLQPQGSIKEQRRWLGNSCPNCLAPVDLICGGFPCQDVSLAGKRTGLEGKRTTLWSEFARLIRELRPKWVLAENVPGLYSANNGRFFGNILRDLAESGYDAEWDCIPAAAVGAPHRRYRVFIVAYRQNQYGKWSISKGNQTEQSEGTFGDRSSLSQFVADANRTGLAEWQGSIFAKGTFPALDRCDWWTTEPRLGELVDGISPELARGFIRLVKGCPDRVNKLRALGNAVVPQVIEWIGRRIIQVDNEMRVNENTTS